MIVEVNPIVSEAYADLIVEHTAVEALLKTYPEAIVHPINISVSLVNIPVELITNETVKELGYSILPSVTGLVSQASLEASGILKQRSFPSLNLRGQGVLLGFFDTGIDYTNPIFKYADGTTRIAAIWDQTIQSGKPPEGFFYGTEYTREQINQALQSDNPLEIVPTKDENGHGTMLAGIAGGNEVPENDFYGVASGAEFVFVKLKPTKKFLKDFFFIPEDAVSYQENDLSFALEYLLDIFERLSRPMTICIAVDTAQGPHDGRGTMSNYLSLITATAGIAVIIAAGNEGNSRRHYFGLPNRTTGYDTVELNVGEKEGNFSMELWGQYPSIFSVDITSPSGESIPRITSNVNNFYELTFIFEDTIIYLDYQVVESLSGYQQILFRFLKPAAGIWKFNVYRRGDIENGFHIWLPMNGFLSNNTYFIRSDPYTTILALATVNLPITITAYNPADDILYINASRGYNSSGEITPDIAAPGVNVTGPTIDKTFTQYSGTGVAAAHTSGVAAMLLEWGIVKGNLPNMSTVEMRRLMERGARRDTNLVYPNRDWGYGILDVFNVFESLRSGMET